MSLSMSVQFSATIVDQLGVEAIATAYALVDPTAAITEIDAYWDEWVTKLDACIDGYVSASDWRVLPTLPGGIKSSPVALSRCTQTGVLNFTTDEDTHRWGCDIPALSNDPTVITFVGGKPQINLTPGNPVPILLALLTATGSSVLEFTNVAFWPLLTLRDSLISFRQRGEQTPRRSYQI